MKMFIFTILFCSQLNFVFAENAEGDKWQARRDEMVKNLTERKTSLERIIACLTAATTKEQFRACKEEKENHRELMQDQKAEWKQGRSKREEKKQ
jgi:hypothetical protein